MWEIWGALLVIIFVCWCIMITYSLHTLDKKVNELEELLDSITREVSKSSKEAKGTSKEEKEENRDTSYE